MAGESQASRSGIVSTQLTQLQVLLGAILPDNAFYHEKLAGTGINGGILDLEEFSRHCPFTRKQELIDDQQRHPPYGRNRTFPLERYTRFHQTSGTTGSPLRWLDTPASWDWMVRNWQEVYRAAGVTSSDHVFFAFSFGPFLGFWTAFEAAAQIGCLCLPGGGLGSAARLRVMRDNGATVLCCTPTYAIRLAEVAEAEKISLRAGSIKTVIVAGEPGGSIPATRARLEQLWPGARVFDHHGMTEVGPVTYECPARPGVLHVIETAYFTEIVDPATGQAVPPGTIGELVLTTLGRTGSPLLRYRTGDLVKTVPIPRPSRLPPEPCPCGRHEIALDGGILGRTDDMVIVRGVNIFPNAVEEIIRGFDEIVEYQVQIQTDRTLTELSLLVEPVPGIVDSAHLLGRLEKAFLAAFALRVPISLAPPGTLPRFEMKAQRWRRR